MVGGLRESGGAESGGGLRKGLREARRARGHAAGPGEGKGRGGWGWGVRGAPKETRGPPGVGYPGGSGNCGGKLKGFSGSVSPGMLLAGCP